MTGPLCSYVAEACDRVAPMIPAGPFADLVHRVRAGLDEPLRVAVAGRVNSGKSTLVNALLQQRVAPTDVSECTRYVTTYRFGIPERMEVVRVDGTRTAVPLMADGSLPRSPGEGDVEISRLEVSLANEALRDLVLIDTPGLGSLNEEFSADTTALLGLDGQSREAVADADALVYVMTSSLRADEVDLLRGFRDVLAGTNATALSLTCVLNKADLVAGDGDPLDVARELAARFSDALRDVVGEVRPLVSLVAESVDTGRFSEGHAVALRALAELPAPEIESLLLTADRFVSGTAPVAQADRAALLEILGLRGVALALELVRRGSSTAAALLAQLRAASGVEGLRQTVLGDFARNADALKAHGALAALERLTYSMVDPDVADARLELHDAIDAVRVAPEMHRIDELRALQECATGAVELPGELELDVRRLVTEPTAHARLGLPPSASLEEVQRAASTAAGAWKRFRNDGRSSPNQQWVADVMTRTCEQLWLDTATRRGGPA